LDVTDFPDEREPGEYGLDMALIDPRNDSRIPAPEDSTVVLLASYKVLDETVPKDASLRLQLTGKRPDGKDLNILYDLIEPAPEDDNIAFLEPDPALDGLPGVVDSSVFWVDLQPLVLDKTLQAADRLTLSYGNLSDSVTVMASMLAP
jgi:hypothetical protein